MSAMPRTMAIPDSSGSILRRDVGVDQVPRFVSRQIDRDAAHEREARAGLDDGPVVGKA